MVPVLSRHLPEGANASGGQSPVTDTCLIRAVPQKLEAGFGQW